MYNIERYNFIIAKDSISVLSNDITIIKGLEIYIQLDLENGNKFWFTRNSNIFEYELKGFFVNYKTQSLIVEWIETIKDHENNLISSKLKSIIEYNPPQSIHVKQCINKIMYNEIKYTCFNALGEFEPS